jgi:hypothetical protein
MYHAGWSEHGPHNRSPLQRQEKEKERVRQTLKGSLPRPFVFWGFFFFSTGALVVWKIVFVFISK